MGSAPTFAIAIPIHSIEKNYNRITIAIFVHSHWRFITRLRPQLPLISGMGGAPTFANAISIRPIEMNRNRLINGSCK